MKPATRIGGHSAFSVWEQAINNPEPFYVYDSNKPKSSAEKVSDILLNLGEGTEISLSSFVHEFRNQFGSTYGLLKYEKAAALHAYGCFIKERTSKESDLEPALRTEFRRVFNPEAPAACLECGKDCIAPGHPPNYCSVTCKEAGFVYSCKECGAIDKFENFHCLACDKGVSPPSKPSEVMRRDVHTQDVVRQTKRKIDEVSKTEKTCTRDLASIEKAITRALKEQTPDVAHLQELQQDKETKETGAAQASAQLSQLQPKLQASEAELEELLTPEGQKKVEEEYEQQTRSAQQAFEDLRRTAAMLYSQPVRDTRHEPAWKRAR